MGSQHMLSQLNVKVSRATSHNEAPYFLLVCENKKKSIFASF